MREALKKVGGYGVPLYFTGEYLTNEKKYGGKLKKNKK